ncbi:hypothetical protein Cni_G12129 [Canna indica]|uniref:Nucleolar pre-ribosomal-associated protein 1 n=1 Tax=Canna indica TaxID=4628 RepID=A0AAQ3K8V0_9LILI|nr:hypothetical protein Cni_G12129 [Canna indica]
MEDAEVINEKDLDYVLSPLDLASNPSRVVAEFSDQDEDSQEEEDATRGEGSTQPVLSSYRVKIIEIVKNLHSPEITIYSEASKEFISLLRGESGGGILREYIQLAPKCSEIEEAWRLHQGKPGMSHILSLVSVILDHPDGKSRANGFSTNLDSFARLLIDTKLTDIYAELNSQEQRRQSAALHLLASVVKRGGRLASEVAKVFNFKLPVLSKLSGLQKKKRKDERRGSRRSTRRAFVGFAMSFIEVGNPRLLRWVLQQRELYSGVLRGLGSDEAETVIYVLSTLRNKVLVEDSLVPPALRSVLFGSTTLEQLSCISGNPMAGHAADIAHEVLVMVCTDPANGLMPGVKLKGNEKRLFDLTKKLKATEVGYHRELLLAIVSKRPSLSAAYMDEFPYHLEPRSSSSWFSAVSLAADVISSVNIEAATMSFSYVPEHPPAFFSGELQHIFKSIVPRACSRSLVNKGLLHADVLVKHGSLRLILESLKSLGDLIMRIGDAIKSNLTSDNSYSKEIAELHGLPGITCFARLDKFLDDRGLCHIDNVESKKWVSLRQYILDEVRGLLPDPQVLLKLLSSLSYKHSSKRSKRTNALPEVTGKRLKIDITTENVDIIISGMDTEPTNIASGHQNEAKNVATVPELDGDKERRAIVAEIWGLNKQKMVTTEPVDEQDFFYSKLLDTLALYMRITPSAFEGSFDFFKILPSNALNLPTGQLQSILSLLVESIGHSPRSSASVSAPDFMYKHLQPLTNLLIYSPCEEIRAQANLLAKVSLISTGAFDQNPSEVDAWIISLPGYNKTLRSSMDNKGADSFHSLYAVVISFLCDAVSTVGNNLYKSLDQMHKLISNLENVQDDSPGFSPLIICVLQKCLRLLESDSGTFKLYERVTISFYVSNALKLILQSQVDMKILPGLINMILNEKFVDDSKISLCEWRPLKNLLLFSQKVSKQRRCTLNFMRESISEGYNSFQLINSKLKEFVGEEHTDNHHEVAFAFLSSMICASFEDVLRNLHLILTIAPLHFSSYVQFLSYLLFLEPTFLAEVVNLWPDMFLSCLKKMKYTVRNGIRENSDRSLGVNESDDCVYSAGLSLFSGNLISEESAATVFSFFFRQSSFYALFSAVVCLGSYKSCTTKILEILRSPKIADLLKDKVVEGSTDDLVLFLRCVLFWAHQIMSSYKVEPSDLLEELFQMCFTLVDCIFEHVLLDSAYAVDPVNSEQPSPSKYVQDLLEIFLYHPLVICSVSDPIYCRGDITKEKLHDSTDSLLTYSKQSFHKMDYLVLELLSKVSENLLYRASGSQCSAQIHVFGKLVLKASRHLIQKITLLFREKFDVCVERRDFNALLPYFYIFHSMMQFVCPFDLFELAHWMFSKVETDIPGCCLELLSPVSFCVYIADGALDSLFGYLKQSSNTSEPYGLYGTNDRSFNTAILQKIYYNILNLVICSDMKSATIFLLKVCNFVYNQRALNPRSTSLPLHMLFSRMVVHSPMKLFLCCLYPTDKVKARILSMLIEVSPVHMSLFGRLFLGILNKDLSVLQVLNTDGAMPLRNIVVDKNYNYILSEDDFMLLLPAALSYYTSHREDLKFIENIPNFYSEILLKNFSNWKNYVSLSIFQEEYLDHRVMSFDDFQNYLNSSLLGKAVIILHYFFILNGSSVAKKQRLKIFDSIYPHSFELLDDDLRELNHSSYQESLKIITESCAKISFTRLLLSPVESLTQVLGMETRKTHEMTQERESKSLNCAKLRFITILVNSLDQIVRTFPLKSYSSSKCCTSDSYIICSFFERYILKNIIELTIESKGYFDQLHSIHFLNHFIRSCLLHRFEDPVTLKAVRCFLAALSERTFSPSEILGLLLGHSQFVSTILLSDAFSDSSALAANESLLQSPQSILKLLDISYNGHRSPEFVVATRSGVEERRLELIKLLRVLYQNKRREENAGSENVDQKDSRELLVLLLSAYGATLSETDLEILHLMHEIESIEGSEYEKIAEMDYLWGNSVLKIKKEVILDQQSSSAMTSYSESPEDLRKMLFRENIPVDATKCLMTVLHFCYDRSSITAPVSSVERLFQDKFVYAVEQRSKGDLVQGYDPAFILRFSLHNLVMGFIEPLEFSQLGLLAIAFISVASLDEELRILGYEVLGRFKLALENCQRNKHLLQLQLLLTYFQNGIREPWEKVPSVFAIFAAEASFILLDTRQNHFLTISKLLMHSPSMNFKSVPLFHTFFGSTSIHFKMERIWILQLLHAGINLDDDAKAYRRNKILELLLSFHASSMSDSQLGFIILKVVKKSVKLPILADYLVKECGLLSWLVAVLSYYSARLHRDQKQFSLRVLELVLKVVNDVVSTRSDSEWLHECGLEQLSELSSHLHVLFVNDLKLLKENVSVLNLMLHVMISTIRLSHKRTIFQPHFTISLEGLFKLYLSINNELSNKDFAMANELAVMTILMNTPWPVISALDKARLVKLVRWIYSASLQSLSSKRYLYRESYAHLLLSHKEQQENESLISKLLRWLTASVILGSISKRSFNIKTEFSLRKSTFETLQSLLDFITKEESNSGEENFNCNEALAVLILYLQQVLGKSSADLRSVIFALCLLLLPDGLNMTVGKNHLAENLPQIALLCSKICCPVEANPAWRWCVHQLLHCLHLLH